MSACRFGLEAVDRMLRVVRGCPERPFGDAIFVVVSDVFIVYVCLMHSFRVVTGSKRTLSFHEQRPPKPSISVSRRVNCGDASRNAISLPTYELKLIPSGHTSCDKSAMETVFRVTKERSTCPPKLSRMQVWWTLCLLNSSLDNGTNSS